jgi:hypothetical protein
MKFLLQIFIQNFLQNFETFRIKIKLIPHNSSSCCTLKLKLIVDTVEFDPRVLLLTNSLSSVTIDNFPPPQQALWFFNPYGSDIKLQLTTHDTKLLFVDDEITVKHYEHSAARVVFNPRIVGSFNVSQKFGSNFKNC